MKFSHINTREIHPAYRAVSLSGPARLPYKQALRSKSAFTTDKYTSIKQTMNVYWCNGKNIFIWRKMECSIQLGCRLVDWNTSDIDGLHNMAECRHLENCQIGADFLNCSTLLTNGNLSNLYYDGKIIKWNGDLTLLKRITSEIFRLDGKWSSPGGKRKKFESSNTDLSFTWYPDKQNLLIFQGRGGDTLQNVYIRYCEVKQSKSATEFSNECYESDRLSADNISVCTSHDIKNSIPINSAVGISAETSEHSPENDTQAKKHKNVRSDPSVCELLNKSDCGCQCGVLTAELEGSSLIWLL
jgi:hypothetical protein